MKRCQRLRIVPLALLGLLCLLPARGGTPVDPRNLMRNGDFEEAGTPIPGWTPTVAAGVSYETTPTAITGKQALKVTLPTPGRASILSDPCTVTAGEEYLLTFWYRADGMSTKGGAWDGCASTLHLVWLDAAGKTLKQSLFAQPYGPVAEYSMATFKAAAPPTAVQVRCRIDAFTTKEYTGPPTILYYDQIRLAKLARVVMPAAPQQWSYLHHRYYAGMQQVADPDASQGQAVLAEVGKARKYAGLTWGQYTGDQPVGDYLVTFRLKVKDNTKTAPVASLNINVLGALGSRVMEDITLLPTDFRQPGVYQDFTIRFIRPEVGVLSFVVTFLEGADLWFDKSTVVQLATFTTDKEQAAIWLGE
ncbi:MAG: carbohydrate binding domain-containing protein [Armatimonadota bacterium]